MTVPEKQVAAQHETTRREQSLTRFCHQRPPTRWVGVLTPLRGHYPNTIRVDRAVLTLGRVDCDIVFQDESVSRNHAILRRDGDMVVLEDLGSSNGTHVDNIPIQSCVLRDGDTVQFGQNLFFYERQLEQVGSASRILP